LHSSLASSLFLPKWSNDKVWFFYILLLDVSSDANVPKQIQILNLIVGNLGAIHRMRLEDLKVILIWNPQRYYHKNALRRTA